ncbi:MAG: tRNA-binding protein [Candidatus Hodarchaeales archaeon]|jgi:tRNA-binding protein
MNKLQKTIEVNDFFEVQINCGTITKIEDFPEARKPSYKIWVDFGEELGTKQTSAQITNIYSKDELIGKQILAVTNFPTKRIAGFKSEFLILGVDSPEGVVILQPERKVKNGVRVY